MKRAILAAGLPALLALFALPSGAEDSAEAMPDAQKARYCERMRDFAVQAFYDREQGRPVKQFAEDGGNGARIANAIAKGIHADARIASRGEAAEFGRTTCNALMGTRRGQP